MKFKIINQEGGFVVTIVTFFILTIMISIAIAMSALVFYRQQIATNSLKSTRAYYAAEAGIEDALMRLRDDPNMPAVSYDLDVGNASTNVNIPQIVSASRVIDSKGDDSDRIRKLQVVYTIDSQGVSFNYGVQVGEGGLEMGNGSSVKGNVFSNGNISGGIGTIDNNVTVAGNGHSIDDITVKEDAKTYSCLSPAKVKGDLTYVVGGTKTCTVSGSISTQVDEIAAEDLPILQPQIDEWKNKAADNEVITGDYTITNNQTDSLGPVKITGKLMVSNNATLMVTGTIYVVGDIVFDNNSTIELDNSYGSLSGIILSDGKIGVKNNATLNGSGESGSYLLVLSTNTSDTAIVVDNNASGAIFYTNVGGIELKNNIEAKEVTGYKVKLDNNATVEYETGLANLFFSSGPSGGWKVVSWEEQ